MAIRFVVDSMCDLTQEVTKDYDFDILPIPITLGEKTYYDGVDITRDMVIDYALNNRDTFPKSSQVQAITYKECFEKHLKNGDDVIYLALSSGLSGTFQTATLIAGELQEKYPEQKIAVVDSKCATVGAMMILHQGFKLNKLGKPFTEIVETLNFLADKLDIFLVVGDIKWLARGGRVNKSAAAIGDMLKIVPILVIEDGTIQVYDKVRGHKKALKRVMEVVDERMTDTSQIMGLVNVDNQEAQDKLKKHFTKEWGMKDIMIPERGVGAALTVHISPGTYGVAFFEELPGNYVPVYP